MREAFWEKKPVRRWWKLLMWIIHRTFGEGPLPEEVTWETMVFLPKGRGEYLRIGLMEVVCKVYAAVESFWLKRNVDLHDALHGFRVGRGLGTATLDSKLVQKLTGPAHESLFHVVLDIRKAYTSMYRGRRMEMLRGYGMGPNMPCLLAHHWYNQQILPKVGIFLGKVFGTGRGVTKVDPVSPMIFNIVVDVVARLLLAEVCEPQEV